MVCPRVKQEKYQNSASISTIIFSPGYFLLSPSGRTPPTGRPTAVGANLHKAQPERPPRPQRGRRVGRAE